MANSCGVGAWTGPLPGDPDNNITLSAVSVFGGINVSWSYPQANPHAVAHTILYRGITSNAANKLQHRIVSGNFFFDAVDSAQTYYYWIQVVSVNGTIGNLIGPASATSQGLVADMLVKLTAKIDSGLLATTLRAELDQLSVLNANLAAEIFDRETGETSFAQALRDVQNGVAAAHTFITEVDLSRVTNETAMAESVDLLAVTLGDQAAAVVINTSAWIDETNDTVGAMYTAKLTVNGLIGGFGLINDGNTVQAGFDVDTFWIGRTNADKVKPFIIDNGQVFIDDAYIRNVTADSIDVNTNIITNGQGVFNGVSPFGGINAAVQANTSRSSIYGVNAEGSGLLRAAVRGHGSNGAHGIQGISSSGGIGVLAQNFSGGVALAVVGPMTISSSALVTNLNADRLGNYGSANWARIFPTNSGTANAAGAGVNFFSTAAGIETAGSDNVVTIRNISDERKKQDIKDNTLGLDFLNKHRTRTYRMKATPELLQYGMIAQEVEPIVNDPKSSLVHTHEDGFKGISYNCYVAIAIKAIQELSAKVDSLEKELNLLKNQE